MYIKITYLIHGLDSERASESLTSECDLSFRLTAVVRHGFPQVRVLAT